IRYWLHDIRTTLCMAAKPDVYCMKTWLFAQSPAQCGKDLSALKQGRYPAARGMTTSPAFPWTCVHGNGGDSPFG
ncbi:MAG: hypothetical protein ACK5S9_00915, partial [Roseiflexaceae bacterium]